MAGLFVTFEGVDRAGKTTQAGLLRDALGDRALAVREPGGTAVGERVREILKDGSIELGSRAEALLFAAARAELVQELIRPALDEGKVVISDRYLDSSLAYQGEGRGLGMDAIASVNRFATGDLQPDITFLLDLDLADAAARGGEADRFEDEGRALQEQVRNAYDRLARENPGRWKRVDAGRPADEVHGDVLAEVERALTGAAA